MLKCVVRCLFLAVSATLCFSSATFAKEPEGSKKIRVLLTVGGHDFEQEPFYAIFRSMPDVEWTKIDMPKDADRLKPGLQKDFDVVVMYDMCAKISPKQQKAFVDLLNEGIGVVSMHHNLCAHNDWPEYRKIIGAKYLYKPTKIDGATYTPSDFTDDQSVDVQVVDREHPIMQGVKDFHITDEVYNHYFIDPRVKALLKTDHPKSEQRLAWVTNYGKSRVFYLMLGHDHKAYENPNYRKVLHQGIHWAAGR
jgi:uncharacterized protein